MNNNNWSSKKSLAYQNLFRRVMDIKEEAERRGIGVEDFQELCFMRRKRRKRKSSSSILHSTHLRTLFLVALSVCATAILLVVLSPTGIARPFYVHYAKGVYTSKCFLRNNFFVMEATRPIADCSFCEGVDSVLVLNNVTKEEFSKFAYTSRPMLVTGATEHWPAMYTFSFDFFKTVYTYVYGAYESTEEECQFFPFRTEFLSLREVFQMPKERARLEEGQKRWYIGWSNCHPEVMGILRQHYSRPHFLPDGGSSALDWIFMGGWGQGAAMHLDYVQRPSWQAQISGRKTWQIHPPPECEAVCTNLTANVNKGDIFLLDTNKWYHDTYIHPGELSITIGSEYD